ncbi:hypothetical protein BDF19DRAFT_444708 [Syncephalis fuscata]|nr:hypothetical protein BDF19DRAFT_444708 [Syncephalis fuscata]
MEVPISPLLPCQTSIPSSDYTPHIALDSQINGPELCNGVLATNDCLQTAEPQHNCFGNSAALPTTNAVAAAITTTAARNEAAVSFLSQITADVPISTGNSCLTTSNTFSEPVLENSIEHVSTTILKTMPTGQHKGETIDTMSTLSADNVSDRHQSAHNSVKESVSIEQDQETRETALPPESNRSSRRAYSSRDLAAVDFLTNISISGRKQSQDIDPRQSRKSPPRRQHHLYNNMILQDDDIQSNGHFTDDMPNDTLMPQEMIEMHESLSLISPQILNRASSVDHDRYFEMKQGLNTKQVERERMLLGLDSNSTNSRLSQPSQRGSEMEEDNRLRFVFTALKGTPLTISSIIRMTDTRTRAKSKAKIEPIDRLRRLDALKKQRAESFEQLIVPSGSLHPDSMAVSDTGYDPRYLDDPELRTGKRRTVISLPSMMSSTVQFVKPSDLKRELNEQFCQTHPYLNEKMTLSKIRGLKTRLLSIATEQDLELATVALSYAYFEKLVLSRVITKSNRKLVAGVCMLLAVKINEIKEHRVPNVYAAIARFMEVTVKQLREQEFSIYAALGFNLYISPREFMPHFERIFSQLNYHSIQDYLGDRVFFLEH